MEASKKRQVHWNVAGSRNFDKKESSGEVARDLL
jgi:hypothetical protein